MRKLQELGCILLKPSQYSDGFESWISTPAIPHNGQKMRSTLIGTFSVAAEPEV